MNLPRHDKLRAVLLVIALHALRLPLGAQTAAPREVRLTIDTGRKIAEFDPRAALGAGLDGHSKGEEKAMLSPASVRQMLGAGLGPISVRLRTELAVDAWHWNPRGQWSDSQHRQGYWVSDSQPRPGAPILVSYGYKLPRRGDTHDEANDDGYSRLDDGDTNTFWKSNPYLTQPFTGEPDARHPQWVVLDFGKPVLLDTIRIAWGEPCAKRFEVEYARGGRVYFGGHPSGVWKRFPHGSIAGATGGAPLLKLADHPVKAQYLRIWMTKGSGTAPAGAQDVRDRLGYAIREIGAGVSDTSGVLHDAVVHQSSQHQTVTYASSTDPWHRASDRDPKIEEPGVDLIARSGITRGLPLMMAVPVLYDTAENAAGLAAYLQRAGCRVGRYELGEEPDGQRIDPRDFAALYAQTARAIRKFGPKAVLGGPSFMTGDDDYLGLKYHEWLRAFRQELARRGQSGDFRFLSFEWYPFDDVLGAEDRQLSQASGLLAASLARFRSEHLPLVLGEYNYSAYFTEHEVDLGGALLNAETAAQFLCGGGDAAYYYGYEPNELMQTKGSWGNQTMLLRRKGAAVPVATYHALRLLTQEWCDPAGGRHGAYRVRLNPRASRLLSAFALRRPDGAWSLLLINKDPMHPVRVSLRKPGGAESAALVSYSAREYRWKANGPNGYPALNAPPSSSMVSIDAPLMIPPWSISVLRMAPGMNSKRRPSD